MTPDGRARCSRRSGGTSAGRVTSLVLAGALAVGLAGCGSSAHLAVPPAADTKAYPVVAPGQANSVLVAVDNALLRGVTATDTASTVDARLTGPLRDLELAQARIIAKRKVPTPKPAKMTPVRLIVPQSVAWPRFFVSVGNSAALAAPVLRILSSPSAREPYGLWGEATMMPGSTLPATAPENIGSPLVAANDSGLVATPAEVLSGFASYLNKGARTTSSPQFRRSVYSDQLIQRLAADKKGLKSVATVSSRHAVGSFAPMAVRTSDGGALVIGELVQTYVVKVTKGKGKVQVSDKNLAALAKGKKQFSKSFTRTAIEVLVFHVPPRGQGLITVVAAQKGDVAAVAK